MNKQIFLAGLTGQEAISDFFGEEGAESGDGAEPSQPAAEQEKSAQEQEPAKPAPKAQFRAADDQQYHTLQNVDNNIFDKDKGIF